jgi:hypothetical protein
MLHLEPILADKLWLAVVIWLVLYISDYYLTIWGARLYKLGAREHFVFEGSYELTPRFQKDVDALRLFSPTFYRHVILSVLLLVCLWFVVQQWEQFRLAFLFTYGGLVFRQLAILIGHARNIALFHHARAHRGVSGRSSYARWLSLERTAVEFACFAVLFLVAAVISGSVSLLGGAFAECIAAMQLFRMSRRAATN